MIFKPKQHGAWIVENVEDARRELVRCEDQAVVHISRECVCDRFAFRGVPARSVDVLVDQRILRHEGDDLTMVLARSEKSGKYDHSIRDRWLVRRMRPHSAASQRLVGAECLLSVSRERLGIRVIVGCAVVSSADYDRLPPINESYDQLACVKRNWTRYFRHLSWDDQVLPRLDEYPRMTLGDSETLSELNMHASRWLADLSVDLGWNRVIARAQAAKCLSPWVRDDKDDKDERDLLYETQEAMEQIE